MDEPEKLPTIERTADEIAFSAALAAYVEPRAIAYAENRQGINIVKKDNREIAKPIEEKPKEKPRHIFWKRPVMKSARRVFTVDEVDSLTQQVRQLGIEGCVELETTDIEGREPPPDKKRLLVLDINGIFTHRIYDKQREIEDIGAQRVGNFLVRVRSHTHTFFTYIFEHFEVGVWSSVTKANLDPLVRLVFGKFYEKLFFLADQTFCIEVPSEDQGRLKPIFLKNLDDLWQCYPQFTRHNTLIIDDSDEKMINNPIECHFNPGTWKGQPNDNALSESGHIYRAVQAFIIRTEGAVQTFHDNREKLEFIAEKPEELPKEGVKSAIKETLERGDMEDAILGEKNDSDDSEITIYRI